jgi:cystathionine beta-synthase
VFVCPDKVSEDKINTLRAYGAEVVVCPTNVAPSDPNSYYQTSDRLAREIPGAFKPDQYSNPMGPLAHYETTGPEIWRDTDGTVTHFVAGVGTGGTISGVGK